MAADAASVASKEGAAVLSKSESLLCSFFFVVAGLQSLLAWCMTLNLGPYMTNNFFEGEDYGNTLLAMFQVGCMLVQIALLKFRNAPPKRWYFYVAGGVNIVTFIIYTPLVAYLPTRGAIACIHLVCFFLGIGSGLLQGGGFPYSCSLPSNFAGFMSAGQGTAALLAFIWNTFFAFVCFDLDTAEGLEKMAWSSYVFCAALAVVYFALFAYLQTKPWARAPFEPKAPLEDVAAKSDRAMDGVQVAKSDREGQYELDQFAMARTAQTSMTESPDGAGAAKAPQVLDEESGEVADDTSKMRPAREYMMDALPHLLNICITFFISLNNFPKIGPISWNYNQQPANHFLVIFGVYALGEMIGRFLPDCTRLSSKYFSWTMIPPRFVLYFTFSRAIFYVPYFLGYKLHDTTVLNDFWWYCIVTLLFGITHGWLTTLGFIYSLTSVRDCERGVTGPLSVLFLSVGVLAGLYLAIAY
ncbi:nucleoside transporter protein [Besnoitia besnoiti]|uniref:Nucleoside transporter protein n=1 Tax=Besnoitia besnoiti TaxID=94643 RepID=A0A2A9MB40_BESBE|nr:nucleoside transporter protein [Besnoitia besnoiti]PFH32893.1 nucleoside transporter protein [Besnoitia besnoiti]